MNKKEILLARHFAMLAMVYAVIAMALGVFYREFTKFSGFAGRTSLSFLHTHYFALGMVFFLILMLLEKTFAFSSRNSGKFLLVYQLGLNITGLGFFLRGMSQVNGCLHFRNLGHWSYFTGYRHALSAFAGSEGGRRNRCRTEPGRRAAGLMFRSALFLVWRPEAY